jgi:uncharacterized protein (DUF58 family)
MKRLLLRLLPRPNPAPPEPAAPGPSAEAALHRLEWQVLRRMDGHAHGDARTWARGLGLDLADLREYQPDDDVRRIDWNLSARLGQPHVRIDHEERALCAWFLIDATPSQGFGSAQRSKQALAQDAVGALAASLTRSGHRVGALIHHGGQRADTLLPARGGRSQVLQLLHILQHLPPPERSPGTTRLVQLLHRAERQLQRQRCAVFLVSDFISTEGWQTPLARLAQRHEVLAVRLSDPLDQQLPALGLVPLQDRETGEQLLVDCQDPGLRLRYAALAAERDASLQSQLAAAGADTLELSTDEDLVPALLRYASLRRTRAQGLQRAGLLATLARQARVTSAPPAAEAAG